MMQLHHSITIQYYCQYLLMVFHLWRISNNTNPTLTIRDGTAQWIYVNNNLKCTNANDRRWKHYDIK